MTYKPEDYELFSEAVQKAWRHLRDTGQSVDETMEKAALSHAVLKAAALGERSEPLLIAYALAHMGPAKIELQQRLANRARLPVSPFPMPRRQLPKKASG
jgi:hypothetical protein